METKRKTSFIFRLSLKEKEALKVMAVLEGRSLSEMLRECIREAAKNRGLDALGLVSLVGASMPQKKEGDGGGL
jgi:hypothetical protein